MASNLEDTLQQLRQQLDLTRSDLPDDDLPVAIQALLVAASADESDSQYTLSQLKQTLSTLNIMREIDVFSALPVVLPCNRDGADELLRGISETCSAKEAVVALQEYAEKVTIRLSYHEESEGSDVEENTEHSRTQSLTTQLVRILVMYSIVLPRLAKGKKSATDILHSPIAQLQTLLHAAAPVITSDGVPEIFRAFNGLLIAISLWEGEVHVQEKEYKDLMGSLVISTLDSLGSKLGNDVARRAYEAQFPRFVVPGVRQDEDEDVIQSLAAVLGNAAIGIHSQPSIASLIILAHTPTHTSTLATLQLLFPTILTSIQTNVALPETLALLLATLGPLRTTGTVPPPDLLIPLAHILPALAGAHPDPELRHITFRLLSLVLTLVPSLVRLEILRDILSGSSGDDNHEMVSPQMRVAAIGLVKEAVLESLTTEEGKEPSVFASPLFTRTFAPLIFVARLPRREPDGDAEDELEAFLESPEPLRLVESLGLYYVSLQRDAANKTGIRDGAVIETTKVSLVDALRDRLRLWESIDLNEAEDAKLQLGILDMWLDRISDALDKITSQR